MSRVAQIEAEIQHCTGLARALRRGGQPSTWADRNDVYAEALQLLLAQAQGQPLAPVSTSVSELLDDQPEPDASAWDVDVDPFFDTTNPFGSPMDGAL